jgi:hypothetical protein
MYGSGESALHPAAEGGIGRLQEIVMVNEETKQKISTFQDLIEKHIEVTKELFAANPEGFFALDLLAMSAIHRSVMLISGFRQMIELENFLSAAPLIRLQIDNNLRFFASSLVADADKFAMEVLNGQKISHMKDGKGNKMSDRYLVDQFSVHFPWFKKVYEETSGFVHFSSKHFYAAIKGHQIGGKFTFQLLREPKDSFVPEEIWKEAVYGFAEITGVFLLQIDGWSAQKKSEGGKARKP